MKIVRWSPSLTLVFALLISQVAVSALGINGGDNRTVSTHAGGYVGDGLLARSARFIFPQGLAVNTLGEVYVADTGQHRVREVGALGTVRTLAGDGTSVYRGDGVAVLTGLNSPEDVAVDMNGNVYVVEFGGTIRKITPSGMIVSVLGETQDTFLSELWSYPTATGQAGDARGIAVDSIGNVFVASTSDNRIWRISSDGSVSIYAGKGTYGYSGDGGPAIDAELAFPRGMDIDEAGNLYVADYDNHAIRKIDAAGIISTVAGSGVQGFWGDGGVAVSAALSFPDDVAIDLHGGFYIADRSNWRVRHVDAYGIITTVAGGNSASTSPSGDGGPASLATLGEVTAIGVDERGQIFITQAQEGTIRKINVDGLISTIAGGITYAGDPGLATSAALNYPFGVATDSFGNLFISDSQNYRVRRVNQIGVITTYAGTGVPGYSGDGGQATQARIEAGAALATNSAGNLFILSTCSVRKVTGGIITKVAGIEAGCGTWGDGGVATEVPLDGAASIALDNQGNVYIGECSTPRIRKVGADGHINTIVGTGVAGYSGDGGPAPNAQLTCPRGLAVDAEGNLYISDAFNYRIRKVDSSGTITTIAGTGDSGYDGDGGPATNARFNLTAGIAVDSNNRIYVADEFNNVVRIIDEFRIVDTLAGTSGPGMSAEGGPAGDALFAQPLAVAVGYRGEIYVADLGNHRIRVIR